MKNRYYSMIRGTKINIRPLEERDLEWFTEWNNDPEYKGAYEPLEQNTLEEIKEWYNKPRKNESWVIETKDGEPAGQLITGPQGDNYWLGYILHPDYRGRGYTTEAVKLLVNHLFRTKDTIRIEAECSPENIASIRVLEKAGFTYEGLKRKVIYVQGRYLDGAIYSILRDEAYVLEDS